MSVMPHTPVRTVQLAQLPQHIKILPLAIGSSGTRFRITYPDGTSQVLTWPTIGPLAFDQAAMEACRFWRTQQGMAVQIATRDSATCQERNQALERREDIEDLITRVSLARARLDAACSDDSKKKARRELRQAQADLGVYVIELGPQIAIRE